MRRVLAAAVFVALAAGAVWYLLQDSGGVMQASESSSNASATPGPAESADSQPEAIAQVPDNTSDASQSFAVMVAQALPLAEAGDAEGAETVAKIYQYCFRVNASTDGMSSHIERMAAAAPEARAGVEAAVARIKERCAGVKGDEEIGADEVEKWYSVASAGGNASATIQLAIRTGDSTAEEGRALISSVASGGDPEKIRTASVMFNFMQGSGEDSYTALANNNLGKRAWEIAACRRGADCKRGGQFMDSYCVSTGACNYSSYEAAVRAKGIPQEQNAEFERLISVADSLMSK